MFDEQLRHHHGGRLPRLLAYCAVWAGAQARQQVQVSVLFLVPCLNPLMLAWHVEDVVLALSEH